MTETETVTETLLVDQTVDSTVRYMTGLGFRGLGGTSQVASLKMVESGGGAVIAMFVVRASANSNEKLASPKDYLKSPNSNQTKILARLSWKQDNGTIISEDHVVYMGRIETEFVANSV